MYMPGEHVFKVGEKGEYLYFVKNGRLEVLLLDHAVSQLQKGEMFGQVALTTDGVHEFNVRAAVYSEVGAWRGVVWAFPFLFLFCTCAPVLPGCKDR